MPNFIGPNEDIHLQVPHINSQSSGCGRMKKASNFLGTESPSYNSYDSHFIFSIDNINFYGILNGFSGSSVALFAAQQIPSILLPDEKKLVEGIVDIKEILFNCFLETDEQIFKQLSPEEQRSGASAIVAAIHDNVLEIANVGNCHALLCKTDSDGVMRVVELSNEHSVKNEDEILRLLNLGVDVSSVSNGNLIEDQYVTRCLGSSDIKFNYKYIPSFEQAKSSPVIADPELYTYNLDTNCRFLVLASNSLYRFLKNEDTVHNKNKSIVKMIVEEFSQQYSVAEVAQAVVEGITRGYAGQLQPEDNGKESVCLIIKNFNYPLKDFSPRVNTVANNLSLLMETNDPPSESDIATVTTASSSESTELCAALEDCGLTRDDKGHVRAYVDFSMYYRLVEEARLNGTLPVGIDF